MKIIKDAPKVPEPPKPPKRHECGEELRRSERVQDLFRRFGLIVQCSCGCHYELRRSGAFKFAFGAGWNNEESEYSMTHYWRYLGWSDPR